MNTHFSAIKLAIISAAPIAFAIATYGLSYGVLSLQAGFSLLETVGMSIFVFSGSVQLAAVGMVQSGASLTAIIIASMLLNVRNLLYGAALSSTLMSAGKARWILAFGVSDEPFVLASTRAKSHGPDPLYFASVFILFYVSWILASFIGALFGDRINPLEWGLDLAFPVTFTALLIPSLKGKPAWATVIFACAIVSWFDYAMPGNELSIIVAGIVAPLVGVYVQNRRNKN
ncbi:AzlC family ABC transporter permease [Shouchella patagoniensis]|uniref:AzlC family ABC transporter permease n=1 Tax=Shouchella patagoniensis TaxID=228576 RepID=UPI0009951883|nr:AzlC family ABC transporter permease [Shouchella patagoniensis]